MRKKATAYTALLFFIAIQSFLVSCSKQTSKLTIRGNQFLINEQRFDMWGIRVASATQNDSLTNMLISALDDYKSYGVNTINIYLQGSSGGFSDPFSPDGKEIEKAHQDRLIKIIKACRQRDMVVIVGIFYQRVMADIDHSRNLKDEKAVRNATITVAKLLIPFPNVIINIANEQNSNYYKSFEAFDFRSPENMIKLCRLVKETDPDRIVGSGGYHDSINIVIGKSSYVDALLFDTDSQDIERGHSSEWHYDKFRREGVPDKPMVNVEIFGGYTKKFMPPGVYDHQAKALHIQEIIDAKKRKGLSVHFHSNPWCQGPSMGESIRYDLGGMGSKEDPGIRWWFAEIAKNLDENSAYVLSVK